MECPVWSRHKARHDCVVSIELESPYSGVKFGAYLPGCSARVGRIIENVPSGKQPCKLNRTPANRDNMCVIIVHSGPKTT
jgi:hypothetical protein